MVDVEIVTIGSVRTRYRDCRSTPVQSRVPGGTHPRPAHLQRSPSPHRQPVPHPGAHHRGDPIDPCRVQALEDQAVPQGTSRPSNRDRHQRHPRLRGRQPAAQPARATADRHLRQPTSPRRATNQPRPCSITLSRTVSTRWSVARTAVSDGDHVRFIHPTCRRSAGQQQATSVCPQRH